MTGAETRAEIMLSLPERKDAASGERPQGYADLLRLLAAVQATVVREPAAQATRAQLIAKLTHLAEQPEVFGGVCGYLLGAAGVPLAPVTQGTQVAHVAQPFHLAR